MLIFCARAIILYLPAKMLRSFLTVPLQAAEQFKNDVDELLTREGGSIERVVHIIKPKNMIQTMVLNNQSRSYLFNLNSQGDPSGNKARGINSDEWWARKIFL